MGVLGGLLTAIYVIICIAIIVLVMIQTTQSSGGLGSMFGGASQTVFGSGSMNVFNKATAILAVVFIVLSFILGFLPKLRVLPIKQLGKQVVAQEEKKAFEKQNLKQLETEKVPITEPTQEPLSVEETDKTSVPADAEKGQVKPEVQKTDKVKQEKTAAPAKTEKSK